VGSDPTSIWERGAPRVRRPAPTPAPSPVPSPSPAPRRLAEDRRAAASRIDLKEAARRYAVPVATLQAWCRSGEIDAVRQGRRWMATPASVAARRRRTGAERRTPGPTPDGNAMLVPRDAWDRLLSQLGNLHEAGQQLAEARERAARAETEASFLRERLAEMRRERDGLQQRLEDAPGAAPRRWLRLPFRRRPRPS